LLRQVIFGECLITSILKKGKAKNKNLKNVYFTLRETVLIEFCNVSMMYKTGIQALKNVSFKVQAGEFVFVIGLSGSGKSTLIKLLTCEENPSDGNVFIDGYEISFLKKGLVPYLRRNIGMVFQDFRLIYSKTVYENVAFAMEIIGASQSLIKRRVPIVLSIVGLRDKASMKANQLSGGEQQRVSIARAMVNNPMLILADEPTGNLDPVNSESIMALLEEINYSGTTVIVCTHESSIVNRMKRRVIEISDGSLARDEMLGEYNLASRKGNKKLKTPSQQSNSSSKSSTQKQAAKGVPFVRNINIKFSEEEDAPDENPKLTSNDTKTPLGNIEEKQDEPQTLPNDLETTQDDSQTPPSDLETTQDETCINIEKIIVNEKLDINDINEMHMIKITNPDNIRVEFNDSNYTNQESPEIESQANAFDDKESKSQEEIVDFHTMIKPRRVDGPPN